MSQHDFDIANQTASAARADINLGLKALASLSSGSTAPATTYANMLWYDTGTNILKMRSEADDVWIPLGTLDQAVGNFTPSGGGLGFTPVQQGGGTSQGTNKVYIGWDGSGLRVQVDATDLGRIYFGTPSPSLGVSQSWATATRVSGTSYQNTTGRSIQISANLSAYFTGAPDNLTYPTLLQVSTDNSTWVEVSRSGTISTNSSPVIPPSHWYRYISTFSTTTGVATITVLS